MAWSNLYILSFVFLEEDSEIKVFSGGTQIYSHFEGGHSPWNGDCPEDCDCLKDDKLSLKFVQIFWWNLF